MVESKTLEEIKKSVEEELNESRELVIETMYEEERARNDDDFLIWYIKRHKQEANLNNFSEYKQSANTETLRRARAFVQNQLNVLMPTDPSVYKTRRLKEQAIKEYFGELSTQYNEYKDMLDPESKRDRKLMEEVPEEYREDDEDSDTEPEEPENVEEGEGWPETTEEELEEVGEMAEESMNDIEEVNAQEEEEENSVIVDEIDGNEEEDSGSDDEETESNVIFGERDEEDEQETDSDEEEETPATEAENNQGEEQSSDSEQKVLFQGDNAGED